MKVSKAVQKETLHMTIGLLAVDAILCVVFALLHRFNYTVVLGALFGTFFTVLNFFLLGITVQKALKKQEQQKKFVQYSYTLRMLLNVLAIVLGIVLPCFNTVAVIVPFLMPRPVILVMRALGLYTPEADAPAAVSSIPIPDQEGDDL